MGLSTLRDRDKSFRTSNIGDTLLNETAKNKYKRKIVMPLQCDGPILTEEDKHCDIGNVYSPRTKLIAVRLFFFKIRP